MLAWLKEAASAEVSDDLAALATIVSTRGSTPREAGAKMLIYADGRSFGSVGGGCGEAEVRQACMDAIDTGKPKLVRIELSGAFGDEIEVCGGRLEVWIEPIRPLGRELGGSAWPA